MSESVFMNCAKMFDRFQGGRNETITFGALLRKCTSCVALIDDAHRSRINSICSDADAIIDRGIRKKIAPDEEELYLQDEGLVRVINEQESFEALFDSDDRQNESDLTCYVPIGQLLKMHDLRYQSFDGCIDNLKRQRNKIYAHNDKKGMARYEDFLEENPVYLRDIRRLIYFAMEVTCGVCGLISGISRPECAINADDVTIALQLMDRGLKA